MAAGGPATLFAVPICHSVRISLGKGDETRTRKPFSATLRVTKSRPAKLGQAAGSESRVVSGDRQDEAETASPKFPFRTFTMMRFGSDYLKISGSSRRFRASFPG